MRKIIILALMLLFGPAPAAWAADPATAIGQANTAYNRGDYAAAIVHLREATEGVWNKAPLTVRNVTLVKDQPQGYGRYTPRTGSLFEAIDPILLYCEPVGYTVKKVGSLYRLSISAGFSVVDDKDRVLGGQADFGRYKMDSRVFNTSFMMFFTFNLKGLPSGKYKLKVTLRDNNSDKKTSFEQPFSVR